MSNLLKIKQPKPKRRLLAKIICPGCKDETFLPMEKLELLHRQQRRLGPQRFKCLKCERVYHIRVESDRILFHAPKEDGDGQRPRD